MARRNPMATLQDWALEYGDIAYYRFLSLHVYLLFHPQHIEQVLLTKTGLFNKGLTSRLNRELFGNGLLTSDGDFWSRQRRLSNPAFHRESIIRYAQITAEEAARLMDGWKSKEVRNIHHDMMNVTLRIVLRSLFGGELGDSMRVVEQALDTVMRSSSGIQVVAAFLHIPTPAHARYLRAVRELDGVVYELIRRGKDKLRCGADAGGPKDLLTLLLMARDEDGSAMTDQQLRDEVLTLLVGGHETTALSLTWVWYLLAQNSEVEEKLHAELDAVLGDRAPSADDLSRLVYTDHVLREALRLYPPAWRIVRAAREPFRIGDYVVPAGAQVLMSQWVTHRDWRWFPDPERFHPDRWLDDAATKLPRCAYFPFGGGPRVCIGAGFAMMEATILLATVAQRFRMGLIPNQRVELLPSITLRPKNGIQVELQERGLLQLRPRRKDALSSSGITNRAGHRNVP
jgi:cytochrome P450